MSVSLGRGRTARGLFGAMWAVLAAVALIGVGGCSSNPGNGGGLT